MSDPIAVSGDISIVGGMDPSTWVSLGFERYSTLTAGSGWKSGDALMIASGGTVSLRGLEFLGTSDNPPALLAVHDGAVHAEKIAVSLAGPGAGAGLQVSGGSLSVLDSSLKATGSWTGSLISLTGGTATVTGTELDGPAQSADFACLDLTDVKGVLLQGVTINPGAGQKTRGIRALRAGFTLRDSKVQSGSGAREAVGVDLRESQAEIDGTDVAGSAQGLSPTAILANGTSLIVTHSKVTAAGIASAVGISARGGNLVVSRSTLQAKAVAEYVALARVEDAQALLANSIMLGGNAGESICVLFKGGQADLINNTILAGTGSTLTAALFVQGDQIPRIINNIIDRAGPRKGNAIVVIGAGRPVFVPGGQGPVMVANSFSGWQSVMHVDSAQGAGPTGADIPDSDALNNTDASAPTGTVRGNIGKPPEASFQQPSGPDYRLAASSACIDAGVDVGALTGPDGAPAIESAQGMDVIKDFVDSPRPAAQPRAIPGPPRGWDIGAYEYSD